jgi:chaperonin cofactor prefoldin
MKGKATMEELRTLPQTTPAYRASGRMFLRESLPNLQEQLQGQLKKVDEQITRLEQQTTYLKQQVKSTENEMQEVIRQVYEHRAKR